MHEKNKYRHIPWNRYNLEKYRDTDFWSYRPALALATDSLWRSLLERPPPALETRVRDSLGVMVRTRGG